MCAVLRELMRNYAGSIGVWGWGGSDSRLIIGIRVRGCA